MDRDIGRITLGRGSLQVGKICLGTMTFGEQVGEAGTHALLDHALERGIDFLDTAGVAERESLPSVEMMYREQVSLLAFGALSGKYRTAGFDPARGAEGDGP